MTKLNEINQNLDLFKHKNNIKIDLIKTLQNKFLKIYFNLSF